MDKRVDYEQKTKHRREDGEVKDQLNAGNQVFTVIENETKVDEKVQEKELKPSHATNPIAKKWVEFQHEKIGKFSVKDLFKK